MILSFKIDMEATIAVVHKCKHGIELGVGDAIPGIQVEFPFPDAKGSDQSQHRSGGEPAAAFTLLFCFLFFLFPNGLLFCQ